MVFIRCVWSEYHEQALPTQGCFSIACYSLARRLNACAGEPDHADAAQEPRFQLLMVRMSFWPGRWMMFNTSQSDVVRNVTDATCDNAGCWTAATGLRAREIELRCGFYWAAASPISRSRTTPATTENKKARTAEPRAGLPGIGQSGYLRQSGPIQALRDERPAKAGRRQAVQEFCIFLWPKPRE